MKHPKPNYHSLIVTVPLLVVFLVSCQSRRLDEKIISNEHTNIVYYTEKLSIFHNKLIKASAENRFWVVYEGPLRHDSAHELRGGWSTSKLSSKVTWFIYTTHGQHRRAIEVDRHLAVIELIDFDSEEDKYIVAVNNFQGTALDSENLIRSFRNFNIIVKNESDFVNSPTNATNENPR
ncbi:MAG: hypothetical protein JJU29_12410 [Verrucomicrobia bacterium]|nr:hypothetical protein [Verrucomicrobiota bacterium]MCH8512899.1 hypothetical protein [Kiritimatiellia bacterium]